MSHEDLRDCIDPIRTPAEQQISALKREVARLHKAWQLCTNERDKFQTEVARLTEWRSSIRGLIVALIAESPDWDHAWAGDREGWGFNFQWIKWAHTRAKAAEQGRDTLKRHLDAIAEALGLDKAYLPDQLPEMVTALKRENKALRGAIKEQD